MFLSLETSNPVDLLGEVLAVLTFLEEAAQARSMAAKGELPGNPDADWGCSLILSELKKTVALVNERLAATA